MEQRGWRADLPGVVRILSLLLVSLLLGTARGLRVSPQDPHAGMHARGCAGGGPGCSCGQQGPCRAVGLGPGRTPVERQPAQRRQWTGPPGGGGPSGARVLPGSLPLVCSAPAAGFA